MSSQPVPKFTRRPNTPAYMDHIPPSEAPVYGRAPQRRRMPNSPVPPAPRTASFGARSAQRPAAPAAELVKCPVPGCIAAEEPHNACGSCGASGCEVAQHGHCLCI